MHPMLSRILVKLEQHIDVVDDLRDGLRVLRSVVEFEGLDRHLRFVDVLRDIDFLHRRERSGMSRLR